MAAGATNPNEIQGAAIVVLGRFNPSIFHPLWFSSEGLIRKEEAEMADVKIIHKDVSIFSVEWFSLQVTADRFSIDTEDPTKYLPLRDLSQGTFVILEHTPIVAFGFNRHRHIRMPSETDWHAFGDHYAPKNSWRPILENPGMRTLVIEGKPEEIQPNLKRLRRIKIEPSRKIDPGVLIHLNEHYDFAIDLPQTGAIRLLLETLRNSWDNFMAYYDEASHHLITKYNEVN